MKRSGFTLLEVLVAATVISLLSGISLVGYNRFQERQQLNSAKEQLRNDLRLAQQKALAGEKPSGWCAGSGKTLTGWRLEFGTTSTYQIKAVCSDDSVAVDKTISLPSGVTKSAGNDFADFASITGASSDYLFTVRFGAASGIWEGTVSVTSAGLVQTSAIAATTSTPAPTGGALSTPTPIPTVTPVPTVTPTPTPIPTSTPVPTPTSRPTSTPIPTSVPTPTPVPVVCTSGGGSCTSASQCCSNSCISMGQSTYCARDGTNRRGEWVCREWVTVTNYACRSESCTASGGSCSANWNCCSGSCGQYTYCARDGTNRRGDWVCREWATGYACQ